MQQPKLLCPKLRRNEGDTGDVAARPVETGDEAELNRVAAGYEDDRDRRSRRLGYNCRGDVMRSDHRHLTAYQIGCEVGQSLDLVLRPAILDHDILALDVAGFTNPLPEGGQITCTIGKRRTAEETDHRHRRLLRARRERPRGHAADKRDEVAPSQLLELHSFPASQGPLCRISNCKRSVSGHAGILQPLLVLPTLAGDRPLHIWHDERADRAVFAAAPEAYMAMGVLARLHLLTLEEVAGRDVKPARTRLHQLIAGDRRAIHVAAAG